MDNLKLRKATPADNEFAFQTKKAAFKKYVEEIWGWDEVEQRKLHNRRFASHDFSVIQWSGIDVGILVLEQESDYVKLNQLFILPEYHGKGIGSACMELIVEKKETLHPIRLQVLKVNKPAFLFFNKLGFKTIGETDSHYQMERTN